MNTESSDERVSSRPGSQRAGSGRLSRESRISRHSSRMSAENGENTSSCIQPPVANGSAENGNEIEEAQNVLSLENGDGSGANESLSQDVVKILLNQINLNLGKIYSWFAMISSKILIDEYFDKISTQCK